MADRLINELTALPTNRVKDLLTRGFFSSLTFHLEMRRTLLIDRLIRLLEITFLIQSHNSLRPFRLISLRSENNNRKKSLQISRKEKSLPLSPLNFFD